MSPPQKYAVRFESDADKTVIRVRYVWENDTLNVQYIMREDIDAFFTVKDKIIACDLRRFERCNQFQIINVFRIHVC